MKPTEERLLTKEAIVARLLAIGGKPQPKPTAEQKAQQAWAQSLEVVLKANRQSDQMALERAKEELEEAQRRRAQEEYIRHAQIANEQAAELGYLQRQWDALAERRYDPTGIWGRPNYKLHPDD